MNQGIMHLRTTNGRIACNTRRAHMATTKEQFASWPIHCKKCQVTYDKWMAMAERKAATTR